MVRKPVTLIMLLFSSLVVTACFGGAVPTATVEPAATVTQDPNVMRKATPLLLNQIELRAQQAKQPTPQRLQQMQGLGMNVANLNVQRVFIHFSLKPSPAQVQEMSSLGITLYMDSWIPPAGSAPTGFVLADMPVTALSNLAAKDYVVKLETAEKQSQPLGSSNSPK